MTWYVDSKLRNEWRKSILDCSGGIQRCTHKGGLLHSKGRRFVSYRGQAYLSTYPLCVCVYTQSNSTNIRVMKLELGVGSSQPQDCFPEYLILVVIRLSHWSRHILWESLLINPPSLKKAKGKNLHYLRLCVFKYMLQHIHVFVVKCGVGRKFHHKFPAFVDEKKITNRGT